MTAPHATPPAAARERAALRVLARAVDRGEAHGRDTLRAGRIVVLLAWIVALAALLVLLLAWPRRSLLELGFLGLAVAGAWLAGVARFSVIAGAQWPLLSRYIDADKVRRDAAALGDDPADAPSSALGRLWRWHARADLATRLKRLSVAGAVLFVLAVAVQFLVVPQAIAFFHPGRGAAPGQVTVLATKWCPYCGDLRTRLRAAHLPFTEVDIEAGWRESLALQATGRRSIPTTLVGGEVLPRGLTSQLQALHAACLQRAAAAASPRPDCRMLDPEALVRVRRNDGALVYDVVPRAANGDDPESRVLQ